MARRDARGAAIREADVQRRVGPALRGSNVTDIGAVARWEDPDHGATLGTGK